MGSATSELAVASTRRTVGRAATALVMLALVALLWVPSAGAAQVRGYDVRVSGFVHERAVNDDGGWDLTLRWNGRWRNVRLETTFFGRNSLQMLAKPNRFRPGTIRPRLEYQETIANVGLSCNGSITYPRYKSRLLFAGIAMRGSPHSFNLMTQLRPAAGRRFIERTRATQEANCVDENGSAYSAGTPMIVDRFRAPKRLMVDATPGLLDVSFERRGGTVPYPLRPLSRTRGRKVSYTTGLRTKTLPSEAQTITVRHRFTFKFIPRRKR